MKREEVLRLLKNIQFSIPDKDFLDQRPKAGAIAKRKKTNPKLLEKFNINQAREDIRTFHESFLGGMRKEGDLKTKKLGLMSITDMKDFRQKVKEFSSREDTDPQIQAIEGIVNFIDLKNSGVIQKRQAILQDCLAKVGEVFAVDGCLSLFHAE